MRTRLVDLHALTTGRLHESDVPPVVDSSASMPVSAAMACSAASINAPRPVRKGLAPSVQAMS